MSDLTRDASGVLDRRRSTSYAPPVKDSGTPLLTGETRGRNGGGRVPIQVSPLARARLRRLLYEPEMRGVGFTEFLDRALDRADAELRASREAAARLPLPEVNDLR